MKTRLHPSSARICKDCNNLVTADLTCPLCDQPTDPHPDATAKQGYCQGCADGPFRATSLHLVTWNEDPYVQTDDGDLFYFCGKCRKQAAQDQ